MPKIIATKQDWIALGYTIFSQQGAAGMIVEKMAKQLHVNKSSFYWHFKTKKDFIQEIITYWVSECTQQIIATTNTHSSGKDKLDQLIVLSFKKDPYLDFNFFIKRYALKHKNVQKTIDQIDQQRITYTKDILLAMNFTPKEAKIKAALFYQYLIGYHEMIRYKKQEKDYFSQVKEEINQFINY